MTVLPVSMIITFASRIDIGCEMVGYVEMFAS